MTVTLPPEWEQFVKEREAAGQPFSLDAALLAALQALQKQEQDEAKLAVLRADIQVGLDDIAAGRVTRGPINARQMLEEIRQKRASS